MLALGVTLLSSFGQFTLFSYFAPYLLQTLSARPVLLSLLFLWFGAFGLLGNITLTRWVGLALMLLAIGLSVWATKVQKRS